MKPELEIYLLTVRMLSVMEDIDFPENGFKKSIRSINSFAEDKVEAMEKWNSEANGIIVHNFNVIMDNIDEDVLKTEIGVLTVDKV